MKYCVKTIVLTCLLGLQVPVFDTPSDSDCRVDKPCITAVVVSKVRYYKKANGRFEEIGVIKKNTFKKYLKQTFPTLSIDASTGISMLEISHIDIEKKTPVYVEQNAFKLSPDPQIDCGGLGALTASIQGSDVNQTSGVSTGHASNPKDYCKEDKQ